MAVSSSHPRKLFWEANVVMLLAGTCSHYSVREAAIILKFVPVISSRASSRVNPPQSGQLWERVKSGRNERCSFKEVTSNNEHPEFKKLGSSGALNAKICRYFSRYTTHYPYVM